MANVLVELLSVPMENGQYDSDTARTGENGQQAYDVAKLYQENKTTQGESSKVLARTYTNEKGEYKFEGLTAGNYVIKYTYGKNMKDVDENGQEKGTIRSATAIYTSDGKTKLKEIEAREYKSTVITSGEISNARFYMKGELKMDVNDYLPLRDVVFNTLRQAILRGEMEPGERLMEIQLADKLGVSRTPIREAIRKLELEGLVIMIPRKGAEVAHITEKDMRDVLEVRAALEELAATLACRNVTQEHIEELKMANKRFEAAIISKDVVAIVDADVNFHDIIYAMTDNQRLIQIINNLREQMYRYRLEYVKDARAHSILISEHKDIIDKLSKKDEENTKIVIRQHITNQEKGIIRLLNK